MLHHYCGRSTCLSLMLRDILIERSFPTGWWISPGFYAMTYTTQLGWLHLWHTAKCGFTCSIVILRHSSSECIDENCELCDSDNICTKCRDGYVSNDQAGCNKSKHLNSPLRVFTHWYRCTGIVHPAVIDDLSFLVQKIISTMSYMRKSDPEKKPHTRFAIFVVMNSQFRLVENVFAMRWTLVLGGHFVYYFCGQ